MNESAWAWRIPCTVGLRMARAARPGAGKLVHTTRISRAQCCRPVPPAPVGHTQLHALRRTAAGWLPSALGARTPGRTLPVQHTQQHAQALPDHIQLRGPEGQQLALRLGQGAPLRASQQGRACSGAMGERGPSWVGPSCGMDAVCGGLRGQVKPGMLLVLSQHEV